MHDIYIPDLKLKQLIDNDYCTIRLIKDNIVVSYFIDIGENKMNVCQVNFIALSSDLIFDLIIKHSLLVQSISVSHSLYIGKEIYKAELSKIFSQAYIQS